MSPVRDTPALLDGNVLVALSDEAHVHHDAAENWFVAYRGPFATCPITQGTLLRVLMMTGAVQGLPAATEVLRRLLGNPMHRFWPDTLDYLQVSMKGAIGHRQVTDAYLVALARKNEGKLVTFDKGLAALHPDAVELIE